MIDFKIPICILSFNRPEYLEKVLQSLLIQEDAGKVEHHLFQDNAVNAFSKIRRAEDEEVQRCVELFQEYFPNGTVHLAEANISTALNHFRALEFVFNCGDNNVGIFVEDDIVLSKFYVNINRVFYSQFMENPFIGCFTAYGKNIVSPYRSQEKNKQKLCSYGTTTVTSLKKDVWFKIRPIVRGYIDAISGCDYRDRPRKKIVNFYNQLGVDIEKCFVSSQDRAREVAMLKNGLIFVGTFTNNAKHIGEKGIHTSLKSFKSLGFDKTKIFNKKIDSFEGIEDETLVNFIESWKSKYNIENCQ